MGFVNERPDNESTTCCRTVCAIFFTSMILLVVLLTCLLILGGTPPSADSTNSLPFLSTPGQPPKNCPSRKPGLVPFPNGSVIRLNESVQYILDRNVSVESINISNGASLTVLDDGTPILLKTKYIMIEKDGSLLIGSEDCFHESYLEILLRGRSDEPQVDKDGLFGLKFIGVLEGGSIDIHGPWKLAWTYLAATIQPNQENLIVTLMESHQKSWKAGDRIVVASTGYDMEQTEEFELLQCDGCTDYQIKINGSAKYRHLGVKGTSGVEMRAEVGILTRNIKIHGEMENSCYGNNFCQFFDYDTYGGMTKILHGAKVARLEGIEIYNMGQQIVGRYPIHYHLLNDVYGNYTRQVSIHHCFSRCIAVHATNGLLVEDVVGYDTLGHCFFLEDGNEMNNRLNHNLGLVTRPGTLLPSDRDERMCLALTANSTAYRPDSFQECEAVSTFWIPHPANYLTNNSAAGSLSYGYFFLFHREPTGSSAKSLPPFHGERSPLGSFDGNRAHTNTRFGFVLDRGVKIDPPSAEDPRDFLAVTDLERYQPHVDRNLSLPRVPAIIRNFTGYTNNVGMFVRGGDIFIHNAMLSDNDVAVIMSSSPTLPYDQGSHQELVSSVVVGRSPATNNSEWNARKVPAVGVEIRDGPVLIDRNLFHNFPKDDVRKSYAIGFYPNNSGQSSPANTIKFNNFFDVNTPLFFGQEGGLLGSYFGNYSMDGDLTQIVQITGYVGTDFDMKERYAVRLNYPLLSNDNSCVPNDTFKLCTDRKFGQIFVNVSSKTVKMGIEDATLQSKQLLLEGVDRFDKQHPTTIQFQPVIQANHTYKINWINGTVPNSLNLSLHNFPKNSFVQLEICYPSASSLLRAMLFRLDQITDSVTQIESLSASSNRSAIEESWREAQYFWNSTSSLLVVKLYVTWELDSYSYCSTDGCHFLNLVVNITSREGSYQCL